MDTTPATLTSSPSAQSLTVPESLADVCSLLSLRFLRLDQHGFIVESWGDWPKDPRVQKEGPTRIHDLSHHAAGSTRVWGRILRGVTGVLERGGPEFRIGYNAEPPHADRRLALRAQPLAEGALVTVVDVTGVQQPTYAFHADSTEGDAAPWEIDLSTGVVSVHPRIKSWLGYGPRDTEDTRAEWQKRFLESDFPLFRDTLASLLSGELAVAQLETRLLDRNGHVRWFMMRASLRAGGAGRLPRLLGTARDITRIKTSETALEVTRKALRRRERRLRRLTMEIAAARLTERKHIARELHDDVCQRLAALEMLCSVLLRRMEEPEARLTLWDIMTRIGALTKDVRQLTHELGSPAIESEQLAKRLASYAGELERIAQLEVEIEIADLPRTLPRGIAFTLFRVAQEGLRNVAQHAATQHARVRLSQEDGGLVLQVEDRGKGFEPAADRRAGFGITSMTERVAELSGHLHVSSAAGQGTTVRAWIPESIR